MQGSTEPPTVGPLGRLGLLMHDAGWEVVPITRPGEKDPPLDGTTGADGVALTRTELAGYVTEWPDRNYGIRLPGHVVGIDVDNYGDKHGAETLFRLQEEHGDLPLTVFVTSRDPNSGSGIRLYQVDHEPAVSGLGPGIDIIKRSHRYMVGPGSIHPDTHEPYRVYVETPTGPVLIHELRPDMLPHLNGEWGARLGRQEERTWGDGIEALERGLPECAVLTRLGKVPAAPVGSRHDTAAAAVMRVVNVAAKGHGGGPEVLDRMRDEFHHVLEGDRVRWKAALLAREFDAMIVSALAKAEAGSETCYGAACSNDVAYFGSMGIAPPTTLPAAEPVDVETPEPEPVKHLTLRSRAELAGVPEMVDMIEGRVSEGTAIVFAGPSGVGKSFIELDLLASLSLGNGWAGGANLSGPLKVLYMPGEGVRGVRRRIEAWEERNNRGEMLDNLWFVTTDKGLWQGRQIGGGIADIGELLDLVRAERFDVVSLDTLSSLFTGADDNSSEDVPKITRAMLALRDECRHVRLVHHTGKDLDRGARGHSSLMGNMDELWLASRITSSDRIKVTTFGPSGKRKDGEPWVESFTLDTVMKGATPTARWDDPRLRPEGAEPDVENEYEAAVLDYGKAHPGVFMNKTEWVAVLARNAAAVRQAVTRLALAKVLTTIPGRVETYGWVPSSTEPESPSSPSGKGTEGLW